MLVLVNLPYYCSGANLGRYTDIQIQEKCINIFAHTMSLNWEGGGAYFCDPVIQHFWGLWIVMCWKTVAYCDWTGLPETWTATILDCESWIYIYWKSYVTFDKQCFFGFAFFFSASKGKLVVERQVQHIFWEGIKLKIRLKKHNPLIWISHPFKVTYHKL